MVNKIFLAKINTIKVKKTIVALKTMKYKSTIQKFIKKKSKKPMLELKLIKKNKE